VVESKFASGLSSYDPASMRWLRRMVTIPGLLVVAALDLALLPLLLAASAAFDVIRRRPLVAARFQLALAFALGIHVVVLALLVVAWIVGGRWAGASWDRERRLASRIEVSLADRTWRIAARLYRIRLIVEGRDALGRGPTVLLCRHASLLDVLLPPAVMADVPRLSLRYVIKRELLWNPCIDLLGHRLPNAFVRRGGHDSADEIAHVAALARDMHPSDVVVVFPEGTRFTPAKRERLLARLAEQDPKALADARRFRNVLPPHPGGPLALINHRPQPNVVFCAHTGLEAANQLSDLASGSLLQVMVRTRYWHVPASEIPATDDARVQWLNDWWEKIDEWVGQHERLSRPVAQ
jgi:1-acyl-sn-glycerol-3-phosphate acyltransferase